MSQLEFDTEPICICILKQEQLLCLFMSLFGIKLSRHIHLVLGERDTTVCELPTKRNSTIDFYERLKTS